MIVSVAHALGCVNIMTRTRNRCRARTTVSYYKRVAGVASCKTQDSGVTHHTTTRTLEFLSAQRRGAGIALRTRQGATAQVLAVVELSTSIDESRPAREPHPFGLLPHILVEGVLV